jgi:hypothetical protein
LSCTISSARPAASRGRRTLWETWSMPVEPAALATRMKDLETGNARPDTSWCGEGRTPRKGLALNRTEQLKQTPQRLSRKSRVSRPHSGRRSKARIWRCGYGSRRCTCSPFPATAGFPGTAGRPVGGTFPQTLQLEPAPDIAVWCASLCLPFMREARSDPALSWIVIT